MFALIGKKTHEKMKEISLKDSRRRFRPRGYRCGFCSQFYKTPGGLTRHRFTCLKNSANTCSPPSSTPPLRSPSHVPGPFSPDQDVYFPPCTPSFFRPPHTPAPHNHMPTYDSPRRIRWTQKGRLNIRVHPYLDGELFMQLFFSK